MRLYRRDWRPRQAQAEAHLTLLRPAQTGPILSLESRSARQSSRSLTKVFVLGAWVVRIQSGGTNRVPSRLSFASSTRGYPASLASPKPSRLTLSECQANPNRWDRLVSSG